MLLCSRSSLKTFLKIAFNPNFENIPRWKHLLKFVFRVTHESYWFIVPGFYLNPHSIIVSTSQKIYSKVAHVKPIIVSWNHRRFFFIYKRFLFTHYYICLEQRIKRCVQCNKIPNRFKRKYLFFMHSDDNESFYSYLLIHVGIFCLKKSCINVCELKITLLDFVNSSVIQKNGLYPLSNELKKKHLDTYF